MERMAKLKDRSNKDGGTIRGGMHPPSTHPRPTSLTLRTHPMQGMPGGAEPILQDRYRCKNLGMPILFPTQPLPTKLPSNERHQLTPGAVSK